MIIGCSMKPACCLTNGVARDLCEVARPREVDFAANRRGHIVERRTEKRGFSEARHAVPRWGTDHLPSAGADEGFSLAPKAGSDIGRTRQTAIPNGTMEIEAYACSDGAVALLDTKI